VDLADCFHVVLVVNPVVVLDMAATVRRDTEVALIADAAVVTTPGAVITTPGAVIAAPGAVIAAQGVVIIAATVIRVAVNQYVAIPVHHNNRVASATC
jgi:hypothetical protein